MPQTTASPSPLPTPVLDGHDFGFAVLASGYDDPMYAGIVAEHATIVTPENDMKMERIHPARGVYDFDAADRIVSAARDGGQKVRGHTLIWHNQLAPFVTENDWDRDGLIEVMRSHIQRIVTHYAEQYPGVVTQWDVVNEALTSTGERRESVWQEVIGDDYIDLAFRFAHEADPTALLFYNDYYDSGIIGEDEPSRVGLGASSTASDCRSIPKCDATRRLAEQLVADGVPIDGIGFEAHIFDLDAPDYTQLADWTGPLGLQWALTEIDVGVPADRSTDPVALEEQAEVFDAVVADCVESPNCNTTVVWGVTDDRSWIPDASNGELDAPLLFTSTGDAKPAAERVLDIVAVGSE